VIVVLASRFDESCDRLVERWRARSARLLTPECLSVGGWSYEADVPHRSTAVIDGEIVPVQSIAAVVTRLSAVSEDELPHIAVEERAYVSSEMNAFLLAWLSSLRCTVINRPTPTSLSGPNWPQEKWLCEAAKVGLSTQPYCRLARRFTRRAIEPIPEHSQPARGQLRQVTIVAGRTLGSEVGEDTERQLLQLADVANVELLTVTLSCDGASVAFVSALPWVDIERPEVANAILERLEAHR
jgi:hypothetical protein